jgi:hypothetical protein
MESYDFACNSGSKVLIFKYLNTIFQRVVLRECVRNLDLFRQVDPHGVSQRRSREYTQSGLIRNGPTYT